MFRSKNQGTRQCTSTDAAIRDVSIFIYTSPAGLLGRWIGRTLRFQAERFTCVLGNRQEAAATTSTPSSAQGAVDAAANGTGMTLHRIDVEANSIMPQCEVYADTRFERVPMTYAEVGKLLRRTQQNVLETSRHPLISFEATSEDSSGVSGELFLHGNSNTIRCVKTVEQAELVVRCPVSLSAHHVRPFQLWLGLFSVADKVDVEVRVPASVLLKL